jgi:uncharacterized protein YjbJ (UPF0337 family)
MSNADELKGRAKEAAGALAGDEDLKREGRADQAAGRAQDQVEEVKETLAAGIDKAAAKAQEAADAAKEKLSEAAEEAEERLRRN